MKLNTKIILSFLFVIFLIGGIGLISSYLNNTAKNQVANESREAIREINLVGAMSQALYRSITQTQYLLEDRYRQSLEIDTTVVYLSSNTVKDQVDESLNKFRDGLQTIKNLNPQKGNEVSVKIKRLEEKFDIYASLLHQLQALSEESEFDSKEFFTVTIEPYFRTSLIPILEELQGLVQSNMDAEIARLNNNLEEYGQWLLRATIIAILVSLVLSFVLLRSITNPLKELSEAAKDIGRGNMEKRIPVKTDDEIGQLSRAFNRMAESLSKTTVSRNYVDSVIESMADMLVVTDQSYKISRVNSACCEMLGYNEHEMTGKPISEFISVREAEALEKQSATSKMKGKEGIGIRKSGEEFPISLSKAELQKNEGEVGGYVIVASDITRQKEAEKKITSSLKEKEILLAEIHHRVKNNLAVISGLLQMHIWESDNPIAEAALKDSQMRVQSIALVHEKLYQSESLSYIKFDKYIDDLLQGISNTFSDESKPVRFETSLEPIVLNINQAISCSLLINELVVNAYKHAFDYNEDGVISISLEKEDDEICLTVHDNGHGFPDVSKEDDPGTLGMSLVETLTRQLDGDLNYKNEEGAKVVVRFAQEEVV